MLLKEEKNKEVRKQEARRRRRRRRRSKQAKLRATGNSNSKQCKNARCKMLDARPSIQK